MFVSIMAYFNRVSDPNIGGTYMTLLNTISNLGGNWPATLALWFVDPLTWKSCTGGKEGMTCATATETKVCYMFPMFFRVLCDLGAKVGHKIHSESCMFPLFP